MPRRCVNVTMTLGVGTPRTGLWCESCAMPSRVEVDLWRLTASGLYHFGTAHRCTEAKHGDR